MDAVISFTPAQFIQLVLSICAGIVAISGASTVIYKVIKASKKPEADQNERIELLEKQNLKHVQLLDNDKKRLDALEKAQSMQLRAQYALLEHAIDGNNVKSLEESKEEIKQYLFSR